MFKLLILVGLLTTSLTYFTSDTVHVMFDRAVAGIGDLCGAHDPDVQHGVRERKVERLERELAELAGKLTAIEGDAKAIEADVTAHGETQQAIAADLHRAEALLATPEDAFCIGGKAHTRADVARDARKMSAAVQKETVFVAERQAKLKNTLAKATAQRAQLSVMQKELDDAKANLKNDLIDMRLARCDQSLAALAKDIGGDRVEPKKELDDLVPGLTCDWGTQAAMSVRDPAVAKATTKE